MRFFQIFMLVLCSLSILLSFQNCAEVHLVKKEEPSVLKKSKGGFCTLSPEEVSTNIKYLFVIDNSGSNRDTDPGGTIRAGATTNFFNAHVNDPSTWWGFMYFSEDVDSIFNPDFEEDPTLARNGLNTLTAALDQDRKTMYINALSRATFAIQADMDLYPDIETQYVVLMLSDGEPTELKDAGNSPQVYESILQSVDNLVNTSPGKVYLSTGFYGDNGVAAQGILRDMSVRGRGTFQNFALNNNQIDFSKLLVEKKVIPWFVKSFLVYNLNASPCDDGAMGTDSDADGLCDSDEIKLEQFGFDPTNRFSFGDGFSDLFHWRELKFGGQLPLCNDRSDDDHDFLTKCEEDFIYNLQPRDDIPENTDYELFDSDRDGVIDGIETLLYFRRLLTYALVDTNLFQSIDGEKDDAATQIAQHRNPLIPDADVVKYDTLVTPTEILSDGRSCYDFSQSTLPLYKTLKVDERDNLDGLGHEQNENLIFVSYIQTPQDNPSDDGVLRYSIQKIREDLPSVTEGTAGISVDDSVFDTYVPPEK